MVNPNRFYTYAYLRKDKTPYYIGKGSGNRIYRKEGRPCNKPKDKSRVIFLKQNLTEEEAFKHEKYMITVFGRKDLGTGILHNRTDGGEGSSGAIRSLEIRNKISKKLKGKIVTEETRRKLSEKSKGKKLSEKAKEKISKFHKGKKMTKETKEKMSLSQKGRIVSEETREKISQANKGRYGHFTGKKFSKEHRDKISKSLTGKRLPKETKEKISKSKKGITPWNKGLILESNYVYEYKNPIGYSISTKNLSNLCNQNNLNVTCMRRLITGKQKQHKGWIFVKLSIVEK